jgi:hypothetical protein
MVLALLFGKKYDKTKVGNIFLDATIDENHSFTSNVTSYPVESGSNISDHIFNNPEKVNITGIVSDTPLNIFIPFNRSIDSFNVLLRMFYNKDIITLITGIKIYTNMVMTSLNVPRDVRTGESLTFTMEFKRVIISGDTTFTVTPNRPFDSFNGEEKELLRESVGYNRDVPWFENDPLLSFKDQAAKSENAGIKDLLPIPNEVKPTIFDGVEKLMGII